MSNLATTPGEPLPVRQQEVVNGVMEWFGGTIQEFATGEVNRVVIVPDARVPYLIKLPWCSVDVGISNGDTQDVSFYEYAVLYALQENAIASPTKFPHVLDSSEAGPYDIQQDRHPYLVLKYFPGTIYTPQQIAAFDQAAQVNLGRRLVSEVVWMADTLSSDNPEIDRLHHSMKRIVRDKRAELANYSDFETLRLRDLGQTMLSLTVDELHSTYVRLRREGTVTRTIFGHNDRRPANWIFNHDHQGDPFLDATIDYGQTSWTTFEQEFRFVPELGTVVMGAVSEAFYEQTGRELDVELVRFWDRVQKTDKALKAVLGGFKHFTPAVIRADLERVLPDRDWGEITERAA